jgi:hypothetical protein
VKSEEDHSIDITEGLREDNTCSTLQTGFYVEFECVCVGFSFCYFTIEESKECSVWRPYGISFSCLCLV